MAEGTPVQTAAVIDHKAGNNSVARHGYRGAKILLFQFIAGNRLPTWKCWFRGRTTPPTQTGVRRKHHCTDPDLIEGLGQRQTTARPAMCRTIAAPSPLSPHLPHLRLRDAMPSRHVSNCENGPIPQHQRLQRQQTKVPVTALMHLRAPSCRGRAEDIHHPWRTRPNTT